MTLYKFQVHEVVGSKGLELWPMEGTAVTVHGEEMVKLKHGTIVPANDFHASLADAKREAARLVEMFGRRLLEQGERLRAEAAVEGQA